MQISWTQKGEIQLDHITVQIHLIITFATIISYSLCYSQFHNVISRLSNVNDCKFLTKYTKFTFV